MSYQLCRWYDLYPRLSFALKLLYLAPGTVQSSVTQKLKAMLSSTIDETILEGDSVLADGDGDLESNFPNGKRWYDDNQATISTLKILKNSPEFVKYQVADLLLDLLASESD